MEYNARGQWPRSLSEQERILIVLHCQFLNKISTPEDTTIQTLKKTIGVTTCALVAIFKRKFCELTFCFITLKVLGCTNLSLHLILKFHFFLKLVSFLLCLLPVQLFLIISETYITNMKNTEIVISICFTSFQLQQFKKKYRNVNKMKHI